MNTDRNFKDMMNGAIADYTDAIRIEKIVDVSDTGASDMNIREERLRDGLRNQAIFHKYIETVIDGEYQTVKDAIEDIKYKKDECWINSLVDTYEGTELMKDGRRKHAKTLTREKVLELLNMSDEEFVEKGTSINQMEVVFEHFNIPVRLYNFNTELIYRYDPERRSTHRVRTFMGLVKNNHIYTMNYKLDSLSHITSPDTFELNASQHFYISDKEEPVKYQSFKHIDELLQMTEEEEYNLIEVYNDLPKVLYQLKSAKYEPYVKYDARCITNIKVKFRYRCITSIKVKFRYKKLKKTITCNIVSQELSRQTLHSQTLVNTSDEFNRMTEEMFKFNKALFKETHKSKYSELDVQILDEMRTIIPLGYFNQDVKEKNLMEADLNKAFTDAFIHIKLIPFFSEFDIWMPYEGEHIETPSNYTLYIVEVYDGNIFFNKKCNLVYGMFLKKLMNKNIKLKITTFTSPPSPSALDFLL